MSGGSRATTRPPDGRRRARWLIRRLAEAAVAGGVLLLVWAFWIWRWGDPVTALYTSRQQHRLAAAYERVEHDFAPPRPAATTAPAAPNVPALARRFRRGLPRGAPVGRLRIPALDLDVMVVNGTDSSSLERGPGRDPRTAMPGERQLVYVAGHRTTFGAPFAHIDRLRPGDRVLLSTPYADFTYTVRGHRIVPADALGVLRSHGREELLLQACHPRFFATQRYLVDARPVRVVARRRGGAATAASVLSAPRAP